MILVIGGAYQGKLDFARKTYGINNGWIDGRDCALSQIAACRGIHHFHEYMRRITGTCHCGPDSVIITENIESSESTGNPVSAGDSESTRNSKSARGAENTRTSEDAWNQENLWDFRKEDLTALEEQAERFASWLIEKNPDLVVVSNELGYGIVPMEKQDRLWRETTGRVCTCLASRASEVVRVVCGIGTWLKRPYVS